MQQSYRRILTNLNARVFSGLGRVALAAALSFALGCGAADSSSDGAVDPNSPAPVRTANEPARQELLQRRAPNTPFARAAAQDSPAQAQQAPDAPFNDQDPHSAQAFQAADAVVSLSVTPSASALYDDSDTVDLDMLALDDQGAAVEGALVVADFSGGVLVHNGAQSESCITDENGACTVTWTAPVEAFGIGGAIDVDVVSGTASALTLLTLFATPDALAIDRPGLGLQLPTSPRFEGESFEVPVFVETEGTTPGAYDLSIDFDASDLAIVAVTAGDCVAFADPVHNEVSPGLLKLNAINVSTSEACATAERVQVATVTFEVVLGATSGSPVETSPLSCTVSDLYDTNFNHLAFDKPCDVADATGTGTAGEVLISSVD